MHEPQARTQAQPQAQPSEGRTGTGAAKRRARRSTGAERRRTGAGAARLRRSQAQGAQAHTTATGRTGAAACGMSWMHLHAPGLWAALVPSSRPDIFQLSWAVEFVRSMATNYVLPPTRRNGFRAVVSAAAGRGGGVGCVPFLPARLAHAITSLQCFVCAVGAVVCRLLPLPAPGPSRRRGARRACAPSRRGRAPCELRGGCMAWQASACGVA